MTQQTWQKYADIPLLVASIVFLVAYSIQVIADLADRHAVVLNALIWVVWGVFLVDYVANLVLAPNRGRWFVRNLYQVVILALPVLRPLRLLRLLTLLRVMQHIGLRALRGRIITYAVGSALLVTYIGALGVLDAEQNARGSNIRGIGDALWWAVTTITTVGYGDHYPVTLAGRLIAVGLMISGIVILGVVTASFASWLIEQVGKAAAAETRETEEPLRRELAELTATIERLRASVDGAVMGQDNDGRAIGGRD